MRPRVGVLSSVPDLAGGIREADVEAVEVPPPEFYGEWGVALVREWVADRLEVELGLAGLDALFFDAETPEELAGIVVAAVRLNLPVVCAAPPDTPFSASVAALGLSPLDGDAVGTVVGLAGEGRPGARSLADNFALANALRAGLSVGGGPEVMVHLAAIAREADVLGFEQMVRVLAPETPAVTSVFSGWYEENGLPGVLSLLGDDLHDTRTVAGTLKSRARPAAAPPEGERLACSFVSGRSSGAEAVCLAPEGLSAVEGRCRVFGSEQAAVEAVGGGEVGATDLIVVYGCGPRGGPGLWRLDELAHAIEEAGMGDTTVFTDGLAPVGAPGVWVSLFSPEAATRGVIGRLEDGDVFRFDLEEGRILTSVGAKELVKRKRVKQDPPEGAAYAARYARSALPALEGAGFR